MINKAIDIVLLPEIDTFKSIINLHHKLKNGEVAQAVELGEICLPHLSLAMGGLIDRDSNGLFNIIGQISRSFKAISLHFTHISQHQNNKGENISSLSHTLNTMLYALHEKIIYQTRKNLSNKVTNTNFIGNENINSDSINWVNDYFISHSLEHFSPHITLGVGTFTGNFQPFSAIFKRLAVCHLGNYCTCREILFETTLSD